MDEVSPFEPTVLGAVVRHWRLVVAVVVAFLVPAGLFAVARPAAHTATASLTVGDPRGTGVLGGQNQEAPDRYVSDQLVVFRSASLADHAAKRGLAQKPPLKKPASWFLSHTSARATAQDNNVVSVSFSAPGDAEAIAGLEAVIGAYSDVVKSAVANQAKAILAQLDASIRSLDTQLAPLLLTPNAPGSVAQIPPLTASRAALVARLGDVAGEAARPSNGVERALLPSHATTAGKSAIIRVLILALALGLLVGIGLAYLRSYRKRVFLNQRDPELVLGAPLLIDVSKLRTFDLLGLAPALDAPRVEEIAREKFAIAASLLVDRRFEHDEGGLSIAVVSAQHAASCTAVAWRSALALASQGLRVLLIDLEGSWPPAETWTARVTDHLAWEERDDGTVGLSTPRLPSRRPATFVARLPAGERSASSVAQQSALYLCSEAPPVRSQKALRAVFRDLEDDYDIVLVNAPPFLPSADAAHLASAAGTALVVVPDGGSVPDYEEVVRRLRLAAAMPIGYVYCCRGCDVPNPQPGTTQLLRRVLHVDGAGAPLRNVSGLGSSELTTGTR